MKPSDLTRVPALRRIPTDALEELLAMSTERKVASGQVVYEAGGAGDPAMLLVHGRLQVMLPDGSRKLGDVWPGEIIGEAAFFDPDHTHKMRVVAMVDSTLAEIPTDLVDAARGSQALAAMQTHLITVMARRVQSTNLAIRKAWQEERAARAAADLEAQKPTKAAEKPETLGSRLRALLDRRLW